MYTSKTSYLQLRCIFTVSMVLLLLSACADLPTQQQAIDSLEQAPVCCQLLSGIRYAPFPADISEKITIDANSPAFVFETGKSFFAAYALPDKAVPYRIGIQSYPVGYSASTATVLEPRMTVLDADHNILSNTGSRSLAFTRLGIKGMKLSFSTALESMFYEGAIVVDNPRAKYLLIYTSMHDIEGGVPYEYMDVAQVYTGGGYWLPLPMGKRETTIGHSAFGVFRLSVKSVYAAEPGKFENFGEPADQPAYSGNGFSIRPPSPAGYRFADQSPDRPGQAVSQLHFVKAEPSGALTEAYAHSILLNTDFDSWQGDPLDDVIAKTISAQRQVFNDYAYTRSTMTIKGADCRRIDYSYKARNPLLLIELPARGYDIYCIHPEFKAIANPVIVRIGVQYAYAFATADEALPDELSGFYNNIEFETTQNTGKDGN